MEKRRIPWNEGEPAEKPCQQPIFAKRPPYGNPWGWMKKQDWKLSPAYDLTPSPMVARERRDLAMDCGDQGRYANAGYILSQRARFLLKQGEAERIVNDMKRQVEATWYETVRASGVSVQDAETIRGAFVYPGFFL